MIGTGQLEYSQVKAHQERLLDEAGRLRLAARARVAARPSAARQRDGSAESNAARSRAASRPGTSREGAAGRPAFVSRLRRWLHLPSPARLVR